MANAPVYVTTAIYYTNAAPHIGHAYEVIMADVIARFHRLTDHPVFFLTGTDEHGIKVEKTARRHHTTPQAYVDTIAGQFEASWRRLDISSNRFVRTTEPAHHAVVSEIWRRLLAQDALYKATYTGLYCAGCETFCLPKDLTPEGHCPIHQVSPEAVAEENYFFRLSRYKEALIDHIQSHPTFIQPAFRQAEILNQLAELEDISVSRSTRSVTWGIPVPEDPDQVVYVWIDALSNYLTGIGWSDNAQQFETFWPPAVHVIGKDILRFHAIYWPAMLMALDMPLPQSMLVHGFINVGETKISKSLGNVISAEDLVQRFELDTVDPIRYVLMTATGPGQDGSYTDEEFKNKVNADLANNLGNLLNRTLTMLAKYTDGVIPDPGGVVADLLPESLQAEIRTRYEQSAFNEAMQRVMDSVDAANKYVHQSEPWALAKAGQTAELASVLYSVLETLRRVAIVLSPVTPTLSRRIWEQLGYTDAMAAVQWCWLTEKPLPVGQRTALGQPILPRLESDIVGAGKKK